jgi:tetratricopeptide (TPR) repeat protein
MPSNELGSIEIKRHIIHMHGDTCPYHELIYYYVTLDEKIWHIYSDISDHIDDCCSCHKYFNELCHLYLEEHVPQNRVSYSSICHAQSNSKKHLAGKRLGIYYRHIQFLKNLGKFDEAYKYCIKCLSIDNKHPLTYRFLSHLVYDSAGAITREKCFHNFHKYDSPTSSIFYFEGNLLYREGQFRKCIEPLSKALRLDPHNLYALNNIGIARLMLDQNKKAKHIFEYCLKKFRHLGDYKGMSILSGNIGLAYMKDNDFPEALRFLKRSLRQLKDNYYLPERVRILSNIGELYLESLKYQRAIQYFRNAAQLAKIAHCYQPLTKSLQKLGSLYQLLGSLEESQSTLTEALQIAKNTNDNYWKAEIYRSLGNLCIIKSDFKTADNYLTKALKIFRKYVLFMGIGKIFESKAMLSDRTNSRTSSLKWFLKAARISKSKRNNKSYFSTIAALCFSMIDEKRIGEAFTLIISLLTARSDADYSQILSKYKELRASCSGLKHINIVDFLDTALDQLRSDFARIDMTNPNEKYLYKAKYMFITYFLTKYQYKFINVSIFSSEEDVTYLNNRLRSGKCKSISDILYSLNELIITKRDILHSTENNSFSYMLY